MSASLPVHCASKEAIWKHIETAFGMDRQGNALARPHKDSWLAYFKKQLPKARAIAVVHAWLLSLCWLRRLELWLIETHQDSSYSFLDEAHFDNLADIERLLKGLVLAKEDRDPQLLRRFPLLPRMPVPVWFSDLHVDDLPVQAGLKAMQQLGPEDLHLVGRQAESPNEKAAMAASFPEEISLFLLNPFALDGSLEGGMLKRHLATCLLPENYRVTSGPGGYRRALPAQQSLWESAMEGCHTLSGRLFAVAPDRLAADRWQYHLALACADAFHFCRKDASSHLYPFHRQIRIGDALKSSLDIRSLLRPCCPASLARLGIWRTVLGRFHHAKTDGEREEARSLLADLLQAFSCPAQA
ncbi:MAG: hypothetical protein R3B47_20240 [Bacteroidia bacterium]